MWILNYWVWLFSLIAVGYTQSNDSDGIQIDGSTCIFSKGRVGVCKNILECPAVLSNLRSGIRKIPKCGSSESRLVCCPVTPRISSTMCGVYTDLLRNSRGPYPLLPPVFIDEEDQSEIYCNPSLNALISSGRASVVGEFPHMVAIGYNVSKTTWRCGGTLISDNFILTAAHCINNPTAGQPVMVLLGDITLNKQSSNSRVLSNIVEIIPHPDYKPPQTYNDLALLRLAPKVKLSRTILPACLSQPEDDILKGMSKKNFSAAGWGVIGTGEGQSDALQVVNLEGFSHKSCDAFYSEVPAKELKFPSGIMRSQICAGDKIGRKDTCKLLMNVTGLTGLPYTVLIFQGDSGGPLWINKDKRCVFYVIGITSFGPNQCGEKAAAIYTNVLSYLDWIEETVWPISD